MKAFLRECFLHKTNLAFDHGCVPMKVRRPQFQTVEKLDDIVLCVLVVNSVVEPDYPPGECVVKRGRKEVSQTLWRAAI